MYVHELHSRCDWSQASFFFPEAPYTVTMCYNITVEQKLNIPGSASTLIISHSVNQHGYASGDLMSNPLDKSDMDIDGKGCLLNGDVQ